MMYAQSKTSLKRYSAKQVLEFRENNSVFCESDLVCPCCKGKVVLKNGSIRKAHFAHKNKDCGYFDYKGMSKWHRDWQSLFPQEQQEVRYKSKSTGEIHIADTVNAKDVVIEFQNSPIDIEEKLKRDTFYRKIVWVVNAEKFRNKLNLTRLTTSQYERKLVELSNCGTVNYIAGQVEDIYKKLESTFNYLPDSLCDYVDLNLRGLLRNFEKEWNEIKHHVENKRLDYINNQKTKIEKSKYRRYYDLKWSYPRKCWYESTTPVFFDLGDNNMILWWEKRAYKLTKQEFIKKYVTRKIHENTH